MPAVEPNGLQRLRDVIADDAYACTFQSFGQYRTALLKHIANLTTVQPASQIKQELNMQEYVTPPLAAIAYPPEHPFPQALVRVAELETLIRNAMIVDTRLLTRYTATHLGTMNVDQDHGPWLLFADVLGASRALHSDDIALLRFTVHLHAQLAKQRAAGRGGWDRPSECSTGSLAASLLDQVQKGNLVNIAIYAMMLHQRGATPSTIAAAIALADAEELIQAPAPAEYTRDDAETFAQRLISQGWHNGSLDCTDRLHTLLQDFLRVHAGVQP